MNSNIDIYDEIGEIGPYQLRIFLLIGLLGVIPSFIGYSYVFIAATPDFRCKIPHLDNDTYEIKDADHGLLVENFIPESSRPSEQFDQCYLKIYNYGNATSDQVVETKNASFSIEKCQAWVYSKKHYTDTLVTEWNLVCHQAHYKSLYLTLHFIGTMGVFAIGFFSDKFGRKKTAYTLVIASVVFSIITAFFLQTNLVDNRVKRVIYGFLKFMAGLSSNLFTIAIIQAIELTGTEKRTIASNIVCYSLVVSNLVLGIVSYFLRDYMSLSIFISVVLGFIAICFYFVPESPMWLLANGHETGATEVFKKIAKSNKKNVDLEKSLALLNDIDSQNGTKKISGLHVLKQFLINKKLMLQTVVLILNWFFLSMTFHGISFFTGHLAGNPYLNFIISNLVELVSITLIQITVNRFGRKMPYTLAQFISSVLFSVVYFIPSEHHLFKTGVILLAKCAITLSFNSIYTLTSEFYPTEIRNTLIAICVSMGKLGSCLVPFVHLYAEVYFKSLPYILFGLSNCVCCLLFTAFIPNNRHKKLGVSLEEFFQKKI